MSSNPRVILFRYGISPFSHKIEYILLLKNIPFSTVEVSLVLPRSEISDGLGIDYRRIPILAIDNDVYCDTVLIAPVLEKRFPASSGHGTIYPARSGHGGGANAGASTGALDASAAYFVEQDIFRNGVIAKVPWSELPPDFVKDRSQFFGAPIDGAALNAQAPAARASLAAHMSILDSQLSDGREWLLDTVSPSLADISIFFILEWVGERDENKILFDKSRFPYAVQWFNHVIQHLEEKRAAGLGPHTEISKEEAVSVITSGPFQSYDVVGFDQDQAARLGLELGCTVSIAPTDTGKDNPTVGKLVALAFNEIVLEVQGRSAPTRVRCHFPLLMYKIKKIE